MFFIELNAFILKPHNLGTAQWLYPWLCCSDCPLFSQKETIFLCFCPEIHMEVPMILQKPLWPLLCYSAICDHNNNNTYAVDILECHYWCTIEICYFSCGSKCLFCVIDATKFFHTRGFQAFVHLIKMGLRVWSIMHVYVCIIDAPRPPRACNYICHEGPDWATQKNRKLGSLDWRLEGSPSAQ